MEVRWMVLRLWSPVTGLFAISNAHAGSCMLLPVARHCGECRAGPRAVQEAGEARGPGTPWSNARTSSRLQGQNARYDDRCRHLRAVMLMRHAHARKYSIAWRALLAFRTCRVPAEHRFHAMRVKGTIRGMHYPKALHHRLVVALLLGNLLDCTYKSWESRARISDVPR